MVIELTPLQISDIWTALEWQQMRFERKLQVLVEQQRDEGKVETVESLQRVQQVLDHLDRVMTC